MQRVSWRDARAVDFRQVQRSLAGTGVGNLLAGLAGAVPIIIHPGIVSFTQISGVAARRMGYCIGGTFIILAFLPKVSALLSAIPGPVMAGYLVVVTGTLFVDGARTVIQTEQNRQKVVVARGVLLDWRRLPVWLVCAARPGAGVGQPAEKRRYDRGALPPSR